jgi:tRNA (guanine-N7-)-methyltransferase
MLQADTPLQDGLAVFGKKAPLVLDIGFGMGDSLLQNAPQCPDHHFIGVEVHLAGIGRVLHALNKQDLTNIRLYHHDVVPLLQLTFAPGSFSQVHLYFPDPWPKKRHQKRRLVQSEFVSKIANILIPGGTFHLATDVEDYAAYMQAVLENHPQFENTYGAGAWAPAGLRPNTAFEQKGERKGHQVRDLLYKKRG